MEAKFSQSELYELLLARYLEGELSAEELEQLQRDFPNFAESIDGLEEIESSLRKLANSPEMPDMEEFFQEAKRNILSHIRNELSGTVEVATKGAHNVLSSILLVVGAGVGLGILFFTLFHSPSPQNSSLRSPFSDLYQDTPQFVVTLPAPVQGNGEHTSAIGEPIKEKQQVVNREGTPIVKEELLPSVFGIAQIESPSGQEDKQLRAMIAELEQRVQEESNPVAKVVYLRQLGILYRQIGEYPMSKEFLYDALNLSRRYELTEQAALNYGELGLTLLQLGEREAGIRNIERCLALLRTLNHPQRKVWADRFQKILSLSN